MTVGVANAPGKVVLSGEYAVLDGAPAVCMAVNRRASVRVADANTDYHRVLAPGYSEVEGRFRAVEGGIEWLQGECEYRLVDAVLRTINFAPLRTLRIELDTSAFLDPDTGDKIGVGSSAALTVALLSALKSDVNILTDAIAAHRRLQDGSGSGVDIATSVHGGLIEYRMDDERVTPLDWPQGLCYRIIWSGIAADTRAKLTRLEGTIGAPSRAALARAAAKIASAWTSAAAVLRAYPSYIEHLRAFSVDHDLGIFDAGHEQLADEAAAAGLVYKPCGAGGGDVGVLLGASDAQLEDFMNSRAAGLALELDPVGVMLEQH
jgi:phosphomevalonate kinase